MVLGSSLNGGSLAERVGERLPHVAVLVFLFCKIMLSLKHVLTAADTTHCFSASVSFILDSAFVIWPLLESMKMSLVSMECCSVKQRSLFTPTPLPSPVTAATQPAENNSLWQFHSISMRTAGIRLCSPERSPFFSASHEMTPQPPGSLLWRCFQSSKQEQKVKKIIRLWQKNEKPNGCIRISWSEGGDWSHGVLTSVAIQLDKKKEIDDV